MVVQVCAILYYIQCSRLSLVLDTIFGEGGGRGDRVATEHDPRPALDILKPMFTVLCTP